MTGRITYTPPAEVLHANLYRCPDMPNPADYVRGTIWKCDDCAQEWVLVEGVQYNESWSNWQRLTESNRDGYNR